MIIARRNRKNSKRLGVEALETRNLPSTFFVSTTGSDSNPGTASEPWATLQNAVDSVKPGDVIDVESGTYVGCRIGTTATAARPITLQAAQGASVIVDAPGPDNDHGADIEVENFNGPVDYWTIRGIEATDAPEAGIDIRTSDHDTVTSCNCSGNTIWGIFTAFTDELTLSGNDCSNNVEQHGIYVSNSSSYAKIVDNQADNNGDCGIEINADATQGGPGVSVHCLIADNTASGNGVGGGAALNFDGLQNSIIRGNQLTNNLAGGLVLYHYNAAAGSIDNLVIGNTIDMAPNSRWAVNINSESTGNTLLGNTIEAASGSEGSIAIDSSSLSGFRSDFNTFSDSPEFSDTGEDGTAIALAAWQAATGQDKHSRVLS